jgi:hypothetical protein
MTRRAVVGAIVGLYVGILGHRILDIDREVCFYVSIGLFTISLLKTTTFFRLKL